MNPLERKIILASKSPRRSQLLKQAGFNFEVKTMDVEETYPAELRIDQVAAYLARKKASAAQGFLSNAQEVILAADSIVVQDKTIYGKPKDREDAFQILSVLSGRMHRVITGVCLLSQQKQKTFSSISNVYLQQLTAAEINYYIETYQPYDKAGAYAIQEWIGLCKISRIEGTYTNIMGLPVELVYRELLQF